MIFSTFGHMIASLQARPSAWAKVVEKVDFQVFPKTVFLGVICANESIYAGLRSIRSDFMGL